MIKNDHQYRITKTRLHELEHLLEQRQASQDPNIHPKLLYAEQASIASIIQDLHSQLAEYEALQSGHTPPPTLKSFEDIPRVLIQGRIAQGLSQRELAEKIGIKEQQIQRYEATDYESASLKRLQEIAHALNIAQPLS